ncbi:hypothetical protein AB0L00_08370 [Actinoallomurus sp. NPDC052308]|uniref:hypothetical protein n=1 Tax=Actinoallomurus sp. NPDC052308 TaxID=3155530 RepID=UPI00342A6036
MGLLVVAVPPAVWAVVTSYRLLMIERIHSGLDLGKLVFDAPIQALTTTLKRPGRHSLEAELTARGLPGGSADEALAGHGPAAVR